MISLLSPPLTFLKEVGMLKGSETKQIVTKCYCIRVMY